MTKCHPFLPLLLLLLLPSCKSRPEGPSLSEYGARSEATQFSQFEQYVLRLQNVSPETAFHLQDSLLRAAEADSAEWQRVVTLEEHFILDPNSPYRNEEWFIPVADHMLTSPHATEKQRLHAQWLAPRLVLNRPGSPAGDFDYVTPRGRRESLHATIDARKPRYTILFFSNPGCPNCKEITEILSENLMVGAKMDSGELLVVNIYPDEDVQAWLDYLPNYPKEWICGYDPDQLLNSSTRYWLRAIPSLYLLDAEKRVILKDAPPERLLTVLENVPE